MTPRYGVYSGDSWVELAYLLILLLVLLPWWWKLIWRLTHKANRLISKNDQCLISPCEIITLSNTQLTRGYKLTTKAYHLDILVHVNTHVIERFSIEYRKTKTKVIALANHKGHEQDSEPIKTRSNCMWLTQSACARVKIGFGFTSDWMKKWREFFKPIGWRSKCKTNYYSTLKWKPLYFTTNSFTVNILIKD